MSLTQIFKSAPRTAFLVLIAITSPAYANTDAIFEQRIQSHRLVEKQLQDELDSTSIKRRETEAALAASKAEHKEKEQQLLEMRGRLQEPLTKVQQERLANEQQRLALAELAIKSRTAAVERLERKEQDVREQLATTEQEIAAIQAQQQVIAKRAREEAEAKNRALAAQLEALQRENEALRIAMEEEARKARAEPESLTQQGSVENDAGAEEQPLLLLETEVVSRSASSPSIDSQSDTGSPPEAAKPGEVLATASGSTSLIPFTPSSDAPPPQVWMFEELAESYDYAGEEEEEEEEELFEAALEKEIDQEKGSVVMRSRSLARPIRFEPMGKQLYQAEVRVPPGQSYFNLNNRRYRGQFPRSEKNTYLFTYDASDPEKPLLLIEPVADNSTVAGDSVEAY